MSPKREKKVGLTRIYHAIRNSCDGLKITFREEAAFRQEILFGLILLPVALLLPANIAETALMLISYFLILIVELLNTAVEATVDRISNSSHPLAKKAKDCASAAVFISVFLCVPWLHFFLTSLAFICVCVISY